MILGVSLSHDSSIALTESDGEVTFALAEERITRKAVTNLCYDENKFDR